MLIDWFTVIAQVVNFLVLAWLLKRFLYHPILKAIDAREKTIAENLADADSKKAEAEKQSDDFQQKNLEFDQQISARLSQITAESETERIRLTDAVRLESEDLRRKLQSALESERISLKESLSRRAQEEVFAIARKVLGDLAGTTLEARMTAIFLNRLHGLNDEEIKNLKFAFNKSKSSKTSPLLVRTAFALPEEQCVLIESAIREMVEQDTAIKFEIEPELVSGIELSANGQKIAWSIADYMDSLAKSIDQLLKMPDQGQVEADVINSQTIEQDSHEASA